MAKKTVSTREIKQAREEKPIKMTAEEREKMAFLAGQLKARHELGIKM